MKNPRDVIISPVVSEKSYSAIDGGVYTFVVHPSASKTEVKDAVEKIFKVKVERVNTMNRKGKRKRMNMRSFRYGTRSSQKRAIVTLRAGETIEIFNPK